MDVRKFKMQNNISVNVCGLEKVFSDGNYHLEVVGPLHYAQQKHAVNINLLLQFPLLLD